MASRVRRCAAAGLLVLTVAAGCSGGDGDRGSKAGSSRSTAVPAAAPADQAPVRGTATVTIGSKAWHFELTSCGTPSDRLTALGSDGRGTTVAASFLPGTDKGSVTIAGRNATWSGGQAGGTALAKATIKHRSASGSGTFTRRSIGPPAEDTGNRPASEPASPTDGSFQITCAKA